MLFVATCRLALLASLLLPAAGWAQLTPGAGGSLRPAEPAPDSRALPRLDIPVPGAAVTTQTFAGKILRFRFTGVTAVPVAEVEAVAAPWLGKELSAADLTNAINAVTAHLRGRGLYAAQAYLPPQNAANGEVEIAVLEGRIGSINIERANNARLKASVAEGYLSRLQPNALIASGAFDTALLLLNDLPGVRATPSLAPGGVFGTADLNVRVEDERLLAGSVQLDNYAIRELGQFQLTGNLRVRNPLGIGDLATAQLTSTQGGDLARGGCRQIVRMIFWWRRRTPRA